jgi:iron-sulfur cluster assembly protein
MSITEEKIDRHMTIQEIFARHPSKAQKLAKELTKAGLNCVGCSASTWETLESGVLRHGYDEHALEEILGKLNAILAAKVDPTTITLTPRAAEMFGIISEQEGKKGWGLRFDEQPAGCSGFEYVLGFSEKATENDQVFDCHGVEIHIEKAVLPRLLGCEIDYNGLQGGFVIENPNASSCCGCGSSHGYDE